MKPKVKYMVIYRHRDQYSISEMCRFFNVSRSGYYDYIKRMDVPAWDLPLAEKIRECQEKCGKTYGYRRVQIWLEQNVNLVLNTIRAAKRKEKVTAERSSTVTKAFNIPYQDIIA